jgi:predicted HicB family RNase H-like nuclease
MLEYKGYHGTYDADQGFLYGRVTGLPDVVTFAGQTQKEIEQAFRDSIDDYLDCCAGCGEMPDLSTTDDR